MQNIFIFLLGVVSIILLLPFIQAIADIIQTFSQWIISIMNIRIVKNNVQIQTLQDSITPENTQVIGFQAPNEYEDYEDEYEDRLQKTNKNKVGF